MATPNTKWTEEDIEANRERMRLRELAYGLRLERCNCPKPLPARLYIDQWGCALCGKATSARPRWVRGMRR